MRVFGLAALEPQRFDIERRWHRPSATITIFEHPKNSICRYPIKIFFPLPVSIDDNARVLDLGSAAIKSAKTWRTCVFLFRLPVLFAELADEDHRAIHFHPKAFGHSHEPPKLLVFIAPGRFDQFIVIEN